MSAFVVVHDHILQHGLWLGCANMYAQKHPMTAKIEVIAVNIDFHRLWFAAILLRRFLRSVIVNSLLNEPSF